MMTTPKTVQLFPTADIILSNRPIALRTPTGYETFRTEVVNVAVIKPGKELPSNAYMTGYGCSYMAKVLSGTPRSKEFMVNVFAGNDKGWMLQMSIAGADNNTELDKETVRQLVSRILLSLPKAYQKRFIGKRLAMDYGVCPNQIGFVKGSKDKAFA